MASIFTAAGVVANSAQVKKMGSKHWFVHRVLDYTGAAHGTADDWAPGPLRMDMTLTPSTSKTEIEFEDGEKKTTNVSYSWEASIKTPQRDAATLAGFFDTAEGNVLQVLAEMTPDAVLVGSKRLYATFLCEMTDPPAIGSKATEAEYKFAMGAATAAITINLATAYNGTSPFPNFGATTGSVTQALGSFRGLTEV